MNKRQIPFAANDDIVLIEVKSQCMESLYAVFGKAFTTYPEASAFEIVFRQLQGSVNLLDLFNDQ